MNAASGPAASIVASAKQVEVVTSPSAPRVKTFSGTNSPTEREDREDRDLRGEQETKVSHAGDAEADRADSADSDDGGDIEVEWIGSVGAGDHFVVSWERVDRERQAPSAATTCGRYERSSVLAPLQAGAEPFEEHGHHTRDEREAVQACLHH